MSRTSTSPRSSRKSERRRRPGAIRSAALPLLLLAAACAAPARGDPLAGVESWAIQLQGVDREGAVDALAASPHGLVVIDPTRTVKGHEAFATAEAVARLRERRTCLAYLNAGQAESYRTYWRPYWRAPAAGARGEPSYLVTVDRDGWQDNYPVAFWDFRWRGVLWGHPDAPLDQILADGFDGVLLDWVLGYRDPDVAAAARAEGVDPARAMAELVRDLRAYARARRPGFLVLAINGADLVEHVPDFPQWVDGVVQESLFFGGAAEVPWEDPAAGDAPASPEITARLVKGLATYRAVFTVDYALLPENAERARAASRAHGFVPFVSRTPLDRLP